MAANCHIILGLSMKHWHSRLTSKIAKWASLSHHPLALTAAASAMLGATGTLAQDNSGRVISRHGYSVAFGELEGSNHSAITPTTQLKLCAKPTGYRWGYSITPPDNVKDYHEFMVVFAPSVASVKSDGGVGPRAKPQVLDVGTHTGASINEIWFDKEDVPGTWQIRIHVGAEEVGRITFDVLPAQNCP